jgi:branched-chain amino acid transport system substrate-binding protein
VCDIDIVLTRRTFFFGLLIAIVASDSIIWHAEANSKDLFSSYIITINGSIATSLAIFLVVKQKFHGLQSKAHLALAVGLVLWLSATIVLAIYQVVLDIVPPIPSAADYLWWSALLCFAAYLFMTYKELQKKFKFGNKILVASVIGNAIFLCCIIILTGNLSVPSSASGIQMFAVIIAYPILDSILMIPAIVILVKFRKQPEWITPWICESLGIFLIAVSDSWFALIIPFSSLADQCWIPALFFSAHFLVVAAGLFWYIKLLFPHATTRKFSKKTHTSLIENETSKRRIQNVGIAVGALAALVLIGILIYPSSPLTALFTKTEVIAPPIGGKQGVNLGALLPLTGLLASDGESEDAALRIAYHDINDYFSKSRSNIRIGLVIEDTRTDPTISLEKLKDLKARGVRIVIGPASSAELNATKDYANKNGILLISQSSTATLVNRSNIFRFVPDDTHQAQAISKLMWSDSVRYVVPIWRTDIYGNGLVNTVKEDFEKLGAQSHTKVIVDVKDGIKYEPHTNNLFASLDRINFVIWSRNMMSLNSVVSKAIKQEGGDYHKVGVYLVAYGEVVPIFIEAQNQPTLSKVRWYGSDSSVASKKLVSNIEAASFAVKTNFTSPICCVDNKSTNWTSVNTQIQNTIGRVPTPYAGNAYDALSIAALTESVTDGTANSTYLKKTFLEIANSYKGITGDTSLNEVGDRKHGDYDYWTIQPTNHNGDGFNWARAPLNIGNRPESQPFVIRVVVLLR